VVHPGEGLRTLRDALRAARRERPAAAA
jgi:hypothetical protein